jgi:hypothetical protein
MTTEKVTKQAAITADEVQRPWNQLFQLLLATQEPNGESSEPQLLEKIIKPHEEQERA